MRCNDRSVLCIAALRDLAVCVRCGLRQATGFAAAFLLALGANMAHLDVIWRWMRVMAGDCFGGGVVLLGADGASEGGDRDYFCHRSPHLISIERTSVLPSSVTISQAIV